ncbi:MAG TPA: response regulator [Candidatus Polarisedimenticolia bacterium]|jgi:CheY-like chemotaxis protein
MAQWLVFFAGILLGAAIAALLARQAHRRARRAEVERLRLLAHDLRTPLSSITAYSEILADEEESDPAQRARFLGFIHEETLRLGGIIDERIAGDRAAAPVAATAGTPRHAPESPPARGRTILVVDDDRFIADATRTLLAREGYEALGAYGGDEALERARGSRPDVIVMDLMMPGIRGDEALRRLRTDPATRDIPVIITTGEVGAQALEGAAEVLAKPITREALLAAIDRAACAAVTQGDRRDES